MINSILAALLLVVLMPGCASHPAWVVQHAGAGRGSACAPDSLGGFDSAYIKARAQLLPSARLRDHVTVTRDHRDEITTQIQAGFLNADKVINNWHGQINGVNNWCVMVEADNEAR